MAAVKSLLVATGNSHKTQEIRSMLGGGWEVADLKSYPHLPAPEETGDTFSANAEIKALSASELLPGVWVLSDDSGIEVDVLNGAPGVYSARYSGDNATDASNREKLKSELHRCIAEGKPQPFTGRFRCCMVLALDGKVRGVFDGAVEGHLLLAEEGEGGFGYDPLFIPEGYHNSFGVLPVEVKNQLSHRARALAKVARWLDQHL